MNTLYFCVFVSAILIFDNIAQVSSSVTTLGKLNDGLHELEKPIDEKFKTVKSHLDNSLTNFIKDGLTLLLKDMKLCEKFEEDADINLFVMYHEITKNCTEASFDQFEAKKDEFIAKLTNLYTEKRIIQTEAEKLCLGDKYSDIFSWSDPFPCAKDPSGILEFGFKDLLGKFEDMNSEAIVKELNSMQKDILLTCFTKRAFRNWIQKRRSVFSGLCAY